MAEIIPFRAWRYREDLAIEDLTSPLFDVISKKQLKKLYQNPHNSIHLSVPLANGESAANNAQETLKEWIEKGILKQDEKPSIYVYYQYFNLHNDAHVYCRKGFICFIKAYFWEEKQVLRHENTMSYAVHERVELLEKTGLNTSATHGLYTDHDADLEQWMDKAMENPIYETEDYQGVRDKLAVIDDPNIIKLFVEKVKYQNIILADGHHRYEGSLAYRRERMNTNLQHTGEEGYNFHMMYLTNTEADDFKILPTHRLVHNLPKLDDDEVLNRLSVYFTIKEIENISDVNDVIAGKRWTFGWVTKNSCFKLQLKSEVILEEIEWNFPQLIKKTDLTVMHYFIIEKALGIEGKFQRNSEHITYERSFTDCITKILNKEAQIALITNEIKIEEVKEICKSGFVLPPKSTFFYPKTIAGFLFGDINY